MIEENNVNIYKQFLMHKSKFFYSVLIIIMAHFEKEYMSEKCNLDIPYIDCKFDKDLTLEL